MHTFDTHHSSHTAPSLPRPPRASSLYDRYTTVTRPLHERYATVPPQASSGQLVVSPEAWAYAREICTGSELPDSEFGPGFHVVHRITTTLPSAPHWKQHLLELMLQARWRRPLRDCDIKIARPLHDRYTAVTRLPAARADALVATINTTPTTHPPTHPPTHASPPLRTRTRASPLLSHFTSTCPARCAPTCSLGSSPRLPSLGR